MSKHSVIGLYTERANNSDKDFGWDKGLQNALSHYKTSASIIGASFSAKKV